MGKKKLSKKELREREHKLEAEIERREKKAAKKALAKSDKMIGYDGSKKSAKKISKKIDKATAAQAAALAAAKKGKKAKPSKPGKSKSEKAQAAEEYAAQVAEREAAEAQRRADEKALAKKAKKAKADKPAAETPDAVDPDATPLAAAVGSQDPAAVIEKADEVLADPNTTPEVREKAETVKAEAIRQQDAEIRARVLAKGDREERLRALQHDVETNGQPGRIRKAMKEKAAAETPAEEAVLEAATDAVEKLRQAVEVVETENGREFAAGTSVSTPPEHDFAKPSDAPRELESGRNGYKIIQLDADGKPDPRKVRQMTRITTFVKNIDDETSLKKWEKRLVVEGLAADATAPESVGLIPKINELTHRRDVKIAKAIKADRKGKLGVGEVGAIITAAEKEAKDAIDAIVEEAAMLAGRNDKANSGSHLHTLAEIRDEKGIDAVRELHESGELVAHDNDGTNDGLEPMPVTATDLASIEAYDLRMNRLGAKVIYSEAVVVNDELGNAGRLDRILMAKLPELVIGRGTPEEYVRPADARARRYVADIKSGSLEYGAGQISRQLAAYALADLYDLETGERTSHRAARDVALVIHLPLGQGTCSVYAVDLKAGTRLLKLSAEVRRARNTGKKTIDLSVDIADPAADEATDGTTDEAAE